ncbi:MAG: SDR family oxidoreductase, partial [Pseudomonadales bacterium]|nr:SDR family oxidoreductase [Pseudomonadales bacterium]
MTLSGKVALVTGANSGIGAITAKELAMNGAHVFLACRSQVKAQPVLDEIAKLSNGQAKAEFLPLDLGDLNSVRQCVQLFLEKQLPLHILVCNAGLAGAKGMTASGFELTFGVCHVGHFLLTQLLVDTLKASAPARVVVVSSKMHYRCKNIDFDALRKPTRSAAAMTEYGVAKLANVLFVKELAQRLEGSGVTAYALHPGVVATDVWRSVPWPFDKIIKRFMISSEEGAATSLYCATSDEVSNQSGLYYD